MLLALFSAACAAVDPMRLAPSSDAGVWDGALSRRLLAVVEHLEDVLGDYTDRLVTAPGGTELRKVQAS